MKPVKSLFILVLLLTLFAANSFAYDTDLYTASGAGIEPNILIIFDNSLSMNDTIHAYFYDPSTTYTGTYTSGAVYYKSGSSWIFKWSSISSVPCSSARTPLSTTGYYQGNTNSTCNGTYYTLETGNYLNYMASIGGTEIHKKIEVAQKVINDLLDSISGVRVGVMLFNHDEGGNLQSPIQELTSTYRTQLKASINSITPSTYTPLAETLYEAGVYFKGGPSYFNSGVNYTSPIAYYCQSNYVIIMTDGIPTYDVNSVLTNGATKTIGGVKYTFPAIGDQDGDQREPGMAHAVTYSTSGSDYLDDVASYLYKTDLRSDLTGTQNIVTYTIGFSVDTDPEAAKAKDLLQRAATLGHGVSFNSNNAQDLADAFQNIVDEILAKSTSFVAPIVPVSRLEKTTAGDKIYLAFFKPVANSLWKGNIKKYGIQQTDNPDAGFHTGDMIDINGNKALDTTGEFFSTVTSYWTVGSGDGGEVEKGGVGGLFMQSAFQLSSRKLYTYFYTKTDLTDNSNKFSTSNSSITPTVLGLTSGDTTGATNLINYVYGYDAYDDNDNGITNEKRDWILGSFLHSRPLVVNYSSTSTVIFAGSNDGMLHAFDDSNGSEKWGFIPPNLLNTLQGLHADVMTWYVDSTPRAYMSYDNNGNLSQVIIIFGERRGGNHYYALNVTNPDKPLFLWEISPSGRRYQTNAIDSTTDYQELGQTWASPIIGQIAYGTATKWVAFLGGGYDTNEDNNPVTVADSVGRAIYVVDVLTGSLVKRFSRAELSTMTSSIPSDIAAVDTDGNGLIDRLYVGDMGGNIWRVNIYDPNCPDPRSPNTCSANSAQWSAKIVFQSNSSSSDHRKLFYPPDVTLETDNSGNYEMLFFGTGDREAPKDTTVVNRLYAVKDKNPSTPYKETDLVNLTADLLQTGTQAQINSTLGALSSGYGWYITLETSSEKCLAAPVVFFKVAYFTSFTAAAQSQSNDPCYVGEGTGTLYAVRYDTGMSIFNLDTTNDQGTTKVYSKSDRSIYMGSGIPSGVIVTFIGGKAVAYAGMGGGVYTPQLGTTKSLVPITWRIVF